MQTFPSLPGLGFPIIRRQRWNALKSDALSGKRVRYSTYSYPLYDYELPFSLLRDGASFLEIQILMGFINTVNGSAELWQYSDPNDNTATAQAFGAGDGASTNFQLVRTLGGFTEPVFLVNAITNIKISGTPTAAYTVSSYGVITFNSPPALAAPLSWNGTFFWPCRFSDDAYEFSQFGKDKNMGALWEQKKLAFSTEKLP